MLQPNNDVRGIGYNIALTAGLMVLASVTGHWFRALGFPETNIVLVYLLAVFLTSRMTRGYVFGLFASVIATAAFNYFFTEPYFGFSVDASEYFITFAIMTVTAFITSALTSFAKQNALRSQAKEAEMKALYTLTNRLTDAADLHDIASIVTSAISHAMGTNAACLCFDENGMPEETLIQQVTPEKQVRRAVGDVQEIIHHIEGLRTGYDIGPEFCDWPIYGRETILGIIRIPKEDALVLNKEQTHLLRSIIESAVLAMDRFRSVQERIKSNEQAAQERYRSNLLRAISHDLRTPLSGIMGTSEMLMNMTPKSDPRYPLAAGIYKDSNWLHSLVENILSLTRLRDGNLPLNKQLEAVEEVVGGAVNHVMMHAQEHEITVQVPDELMLVPMDGKLIEQVLINLLNNAIKYTPPQKAISVLVTKDEKNREAVFTVRDEGTGISPEDLPHIFQMFYTSRSRHADAQPGIGLGLSICDAIIKAHGGAIEARNLEGSRGAEFTFTLPLEVANG